MLPTAILVYLISVVSFLSTSHASPMPVHCEDSSPTVRCFKQGRNPVPNASVEPSYTLKQVSRDKLIQRRNDLAARGGARRQLPSGSSFAYCSGYSAGGLTVGGITIGNLLSNAVINNVAGPISATTNLATLVNSNVDACLAACDNNVLCATAYLDSSNTCNLVGNSLTLAGYNLNTAGGVTVIVKAALCLDVQANLGVLAANVGICCNAPLRVAI